jgi:DNA-binding transcriptional MerR regulator/methylmalonyl-CoA mutase cobalamin-binding subunit
MASDNPGGPGDTGDGLVAPLAIAAVERETGLTKDVLRVWERRYGFPRPTRDHAGDRVYSREQVDTLRLLRRLLDRGHRPRRIVGRPLEELRRLERDAASGAESRDAGPSSVAGDELNALLATIKSHRVDDLRRALSQAAVRLGLGRFVEDIVAPMNALIGDAWARGEIEVFEEHLYSEAIAVVLRNAIHSVTQSESGRAARPRVLLTTLPQELHGLGLLMAEAILALSNCHCVSLGTQTPVADIVRAARAHSIDIVALSFASGMRAAPVLEGLAQLRALLPPHVAIWAGGACAALRRRPPGSVEVLASLSDIPGRLAAWRSAHSA